MTTYTAITDTETGHKKPVTVSLLRRLRDNPIAVAEGATGAPRVMPLGIDPLPLIITLPTSGTTVTYTGLSSYDLMDWRFASFTATSTANGAYSCYVSLSNNGGTSWSAETLIATTTGAGAGVVLNIPNFIVSLRNGLFAGGTTATWAVGAIAVPSGTPNALRLRLTGSIAYSAGNTNGLIMGIGRT